MSSVTILAVVSLLLGGPANQKGKSDMPPNLSQRLPLPVAWQTSVNAPQPSKGEYRGTTVRRNSQIVAEVKLQDGIADTLSVQDFQPNARLEHFRIYDDPDLACTDWVGTITAIEALGNGVQLVTVRFSPQLTSVNGGMILAHDAFDETYLFENGVLTFVGGEGSGNKLRGGWSQY